MMASSLSSTARSLPLRTLHLKVHPTPRTFPERREVLRVIERFGEVAMFKSLKYNSRRPVHNAFLTVFSSPASAKDLQNVSPLRYRLVTEPAEQQSPEGYSEETSNSTTFELTASETTYDHEAFLKSSRMNPLHGPYDPVSPKASYIAASLSKIVPNSNWSEGLVDWDTERSRWRNDDILAPEDEVLYDSDGSAVGEGWLTAHKENQKAQSRTPRIMGGLQSLWKEKAVFEEARQKADTPGEAQGTEGVH